MRRPSEDASLKLRGRQCLSCMGVRALLYNRYLQFLQGSDTVLRTPGVPHEDKLLMLRARVAHAEEKLCLDREVLVELLRGVLSVRIEEQGT